MKKDIRTVDPDRGILTVTTVDERWYAREMTHPVTGLPVHGYVPSVTWISSFYPKGIGFYKWLASTGWNEAEAILQAAADKGSKIHHAITALLAGETIKMETSCFLNPSTEQPEPLTLEEYQACMAFRDFCAIARPTTIAQNLIVWHDIENYAGTVDWIARLDPVPTEQGKFPHDLVNGVVLIDFKTGQHVWPEHEMQVSAYGAALDIPEDSPDFPTSFGILQLGFRGNQRRWKFTPVEDCFHLFLAAKQIWAYETAGEAPKQMEYPMTLSLTPERVSSSVVPLKRRRGRPKKVSDATLSGRQDQ